MAFAAACLIVAVPAPAQILGPLNDPLARTVGSLPDLAQNAARTAGSLESLNPQSLLQLRADRLSSLVRRNSRFLEMDEAGDPVVRGEILLVSPSPSALVVVRAAGFTVERQSDLGDLGLAVAVITVPARMSVREGLRKLRRLDPAGTYEYNHLYEASGGAGRASPAPAADGAAGGSGSGAVVGLIDTGVAGGLPVFEGVRIQQEGFAPGAPHAAAHGTATASLISGRLGAFPGAAPGASLLVADIYGTGPTGGSAESLARALAWLSGHNAPVINVSLAGPKNALVRAAVQAVSARGERIVAAVGNDGPAAPPAYPASYPEVLAVTAVDARGRVLPDAGRAAHVDFAAPGADLSAASVAGGLTAVRGTSFAAPIVAGRLALRLTTASPAGAEKAVAGLAGEAKAQGPARLYGHGVIGEDLRLAPGHTGR